MNDIDDPKTKDTESLRVLLLGDRHREEFHSIVDFLNTCSNRERVRNSCVLFDEPDSNFPPDLVFLLQSYPEQFSPQLIQDLANRFPWAVLVALVGPLCEGGERTEGKQPGLLRFYWYQWQTLLLPAFLEFLQDRKGVFCQPKMATSEDLFRGTVYYQGALAQILDMLEERSGPLLYWGGLDPVFDEMIQSCFGSEKRSVLFQERGALLQKRADVAALLVDVGFDLNEEDKDRIRQLSSLFPDVPIVTFLFPPNLEESRFLESIPSLIVLVKPFC